MLIALTRYGKFFPILFITTIIESVSFAGDCNICNPKRVELNKQKQLKNNYDLLVEKNKIFLADSHSSESIKIKVKSNLFIISLKLEATKNLITAINNEITENGCDKCP